MIFVIGTYQNLVNGFEFQHQNLTELFLTNPDCGLVKSISVSSTGKCICAGTEEHITLLDLVKKKEIGCILDVVAPVTSSCFTPINGKEMLIVASGSGALGFFDLTSDTWAKNIKSAHTKEIIAISVHPSGKILLSIGKDRLVKLWSLQKFTLAHEFSLSTVPIGIEWNCSGGKYAILYERKIEVYSLDHTNNSSNNSLANNTNSIVNSNNPNDNNSNESQISNESKSFIEFHCTSSTKFTCFSWSSDLENGILLGCENGDILLYDSSKQVANSIASHTTRVKCIKYLKKQQFISCSSDGIIKIWSLEGEQALLVAEKNCSMRILSLGVFE